MGRNNRPDDHTAHSPRVPAQVDQCLARAVGAAPKVHLFVTHRGADLVYVIHSDGRCVESQIGPFFQGRPALGNRLGPTVTEVPLKIVSARDLRTVEPVRFTGTPAVHHDDVPATSHFAQVIGDVGGQLRRGTTGAAVEDEHRIGQRVGRLGAQDANAERDSAAGLGVAILPDVVRATPCLTLVQRQLAWRQLDAALYPSLLRPK